MSLATRCPVCATAFRVQRVQLALRGGQVRCGKCNTVFDGVAALVEDAPESPSLEPSPQLGLFDPSRRPLPGAAGRGTGSWPDDESLPQFLADAQPSRRATLLWA